MGGVVLMLTLGTGIGSGLFNDGTLVPNTEFGHLDTGWSGGRGPGLVGRAEEAGPVVEEVGARKVDLVLAEVERLFWPDLIIIGGGVSRRFDEFSSYFERDTPIVPAALGNNAGIIGAALWAADKETT